MRTILFFIVCQLLFFSQYALAFDNIKTHPHLTRSAIKAVDLDEILKAKLDLVEGINTVVDQMSIIDWLQSGAELEDNPACRASNHFHDPLKDWDESGLTDTHWLVNLVCWGFGLGQYPSDKINSNITWATGYKAPSIKEDEENGVREFNKEDWDSAREYYFSYLTGKDFSGEEIAPDKDARNTYMAKGFIALGHVLHLLQDMAVPAHVRNDFSQGHTDIFPDSQSTPWRWFGNWFENYVKKNNSATWFNESAGGVLNDISLTNFWDTEEYDGSVPITDENMLGLAEYTNLNFVSAYTIFKEYTFPGESSTNIEEYLLGNLEPEIVEGEDGEIRKMYYFSKIQHGEEIDHFLIPSYFSKDMAGISGGIERTYRLDERCFNDYAALLIPRAIGYSAGLLNYFFRGKLSTDNVNFQINGSGDIVGLTVEVKNTSKLGDQPELMKSGGLVLVCEYTLPMDGESFQLEENIYPISSETDPINSDYVSLTIELDEVIPKEATDLKFTLVFRGTLGSEPDAVVARVVPDSKSAIAFSYQPGGPGNESNIFTIFPNAEGEMQITDASDGLPYDFDPAWSADGTMLAFDTHEGNSFNKIIKIIDLTSEVPFPGNVITTLDSGGEDYHDTSPSFSPDGIKIVAVRSGPEFDELIIFDIDSGSWDTLNVQADWLLYPKWSPTGDKIAYVNFPDYSSPGDIYLINPDGSGNVNITNNDALDTYPAWSPDGQQIVFASDRDGEPDGNGEIWSMDITGENPIPTMISNGDYGCSYPSFSPDMQQIVFSDLGNLFIVDVDGSNIRCIVANGYSTIGSTWSPAFMAPEVVSFSASPVTINAGDSVTLSWEVNRAVSCEIEPGGVGLTTEGTLNVSPGQTTTYTLIAKGPLRETVRATVTVTVNP